jgi:hypothetical protein
VKLIVDYQPELAKLRPDLFEDKPWVVVEADKKHLVHVAADTKEHAEKALEELNRMNR